jgi:hypothetical protein
MPKVPASSRPTDDKQFQFVSSTGDILTISRSHFTTVLLRQSKRGLGPDLIWTIRSAAAKCLFDHISKVGFRFSVKSFLLPSEQLPVPVLSFRLRNQKGMVAYSLGLVGYREAPVFFRQFQNVDLLVTDTGIVTRSQMMRRPLSRPVAAKILRVSKTFRADTSQKGTISVIPIHSL